jgi:hypothetical protein
VLQHLGRDDRVEPTRRVFGHQLLHRCQPEAGSEDV